METSIAIPRSRRIKANRQKDLRRGVNVALGLIGAGERVVVTDRYTFIGGQGFGHPVTKALIDEEALPPDTKMVRFSPARVGDDEDPASSD